MATITLYAGQEKRQMYRTDFGTLWEKARVGCSERAASKHVCYQGETDASPGWMHETSARGWCTGVTQRDGMGREVGGGWETGWGTHVNPWLIHVSARQKPLQYCRVISLQRIKINGKKNNDNKTSPERTSLRNRPPRRPFLAPTGAQRAAAAAGGAPSGLLGGGENQSESLARAAASHRPAGSTSEVLLGPGEPQKITRGRKG